MLSFQKKQSQKHAFHLVDSSPWPILLAFSLFSFLVGVTMYLHRYAFGSFLFFFGLVCVCGVLFFWWLDVVREATFGGFHTSSVRSGIKVAMLVFIVSEIMFFVGFFWAFFHSSLSPDFHIGAVWPPVGITPLNPWGLPLANTLILLSSGATLTWAHNYLVKEPLHNSSTQSQDTYYGLIATIVLALLFTSLQYYEYNAASFNLSDGIYGSVFYLTTGFHGLHVIVGTIFLSVCLYRYTEGHFTLNGNFINFELASWYWHFVDVVWIFLFIFVYWWGGSFIIPTVTQA